MLPPRCSQSACMNIDVNKLTGHGSPIWRHDPSSSHGWKAPSASDCR